MNALSPPTEANSIYAYFGEGRVMDIPVSLDWAFQSEPVHPSAGPFELPPPIPRAPLDDVSQPVSYQTDWGNIVKAMYRFGGRVTYRKSVVGEWVATLELPPLWG